MGCRGGNKKKKAAMLGVMSMHRAAVGNIENTDSVPAVLLSACREAWDDVLNLGEVHGYFFFSSRRRHTRCYRDWSSDVCSSDLQPQQAGAAGGRPERARQPGAG